MEALLITLFALCLGISAWIYAGYPLLLMLLTRLAPRPRHRARVSLPISVLIAAHNEVDVIASKIHNIRSSGYPDALTQIIVTSDGSTDGTVEEARGAGAALVLDLARVGKLRALTEAVKHATGSVLVFTDADSYFVEGTLDALMSAFADPEVGGVTANEVIVRKKGEGLEEGEGLYWKYDQWIKELEDRVGTVVSASGRLYAIRRHYFSMSDITYGSDDVVISTQVIRAGKRLAFEPSARVLVEAPEEEGAALRRKVRLMNRGLRAAFSLGSLLSPFKGGFYAVQMLSHKVLRRFVPFFLIAALLLNVALVFAAPQWWLTLAPQVIFYGLAVAGWLGTARRWSRWKVVWVPYFFCLSNVAAALAVILLVRGIRFEKWEPVRATDTSG